ncbi:MAG: ABC transporter ATP-binding protein [Pseudomonadota bacterium]
MDDVLKVRDLSVTFHAEEGPVRAVQDVSFSLQAGRTLGLVGESGSGKSVTTKALVKLLPDAAQIGAQSAIGYRDKVGTWLDIASMPAKGSALRRLRGGEIGMIFQEPMASFSPVYTIGAHMVETIRLHRNMSRRAARTTAIGMLAKVGIANPEERFDAYAFALSGGMRQRAMIALALSAEPKLLIADEPTTALDVTIQAQVLKLMQALQQQLGMAMIFISHDLGVIAQIADEIAVMYLGTIVERGPAREVLRTPHHPYTQALLAAIPKIDALEARMTPVPGDLPSPSDRPTGCAFRTRCPKAIPGVCAHVVPAETAPAPGRAVRCHLFQDAASVRVSAP